MNVDVALADELAAWNERRLLRDLYDGYFLFGRAKAAVDLPTLDRRLETVQSRLPRLRKTKRMTREEFVAALATAVDAITQEDVEEGLASLLPPPELARLALRIRTQLSALLETLTNAHRPPGDQTTAGARGH